jgi:RNA polymerase sigma-70 factor (ECF subfamily)
MARNKKRYIAASRPGRGRDDLSPWRDVLALTAPIATLALLNYRKTSDGVEEQVAQTLHHGLGPMAETDDDAERQLIERIAAGDREALSELFHRSRLAVLGYLLRLTDHRELAEDLLQETFIAVWRAAPTFAGRSSVRTWLFGIAHHQAHNVLRRRPLPVAAPDAVAHASSTTADPEGAVLAAVAREELHTAIRRLSLVHREVLALAFGQELTVAEIAAVLDIPPGTVRSRLRDAKRALRRDLGGGKDIEV